MIGNRFFACCLILLLTAGSALATPITFNTALPVGGREWVFRQQLISAEGGSAGRETWALTSLTVLGYGVTPELSVFGVVPWLRRTLDDPKGMDRDSSGLGDILLMARYTAFQDDAPGQTFRIAPFVGVETPTGKNEVRDAQGLLPPALQPGSGSWDALAGVVASFASLGMNADAQLSWQGNGERNGVERGDLFRADFAVQPRLYPRALGTDTRAFLYGSLELNFSHERKTRMAGLRDQNSGGTRLFATPGLLYAATRWIAELGVQIPVTQNLNGTNTKMDYVILLGFQVHL